MQTTTNDLPTLEAAKRAVTETSAAETAAYIRKAQSCAQYDTDCSKHYRAVEAHQLARQQLDALLDAENATPLPSQRPAPEIAQVATQATAIDVLPDDPGPKRILIDDLDGAPLPPAGDTFEAPQYANGGAYSPAAE